MTLRILVAVAMPLGQQVLEISLPEGSTVADALAAAPVRETFPGLDPEAASVGIWSRAVKADTVLRDGDRVEVYRPLRADPKDMRRARARLRTASPRSRNEP